MKSRSEQKLVQKWMKIYSRESNESLKEIYKEEFEGRSTPRREEDRAKKAAIETLLM